MYKTFWVVTMMKSKTDIYGLWNNFLNVLQLCHSPPCEWGHIVNLNRTKKIVEAFVPNSGQVIPLQLFNLTHCAPCVLSNR